MTDPEVSTAVRVRVVAVGFVVAVQRRRTVSRLITVLVTLVTHRSAAAVGEVLVVAAVVLGVEHHGLPVLVVRAEEVLWRVKTAELGAVPEPPAVELVREVEAAGVLAGLPLVGRSAVPGGVQTAGGVICQIVDPTKRESSDTPSLDPLHPLLRPVPPQPPRQQILPSPVHGHRYIRDIPEV